MAKAKKKATPAKKTRKRSRKAVVDAENKKTTVKQAVKSQREIKYKYPAEVDNQLDRKAWRQKVRNKNNKFLAKITKAEKSNDLGLKKFQLAYKRFRKEHYMVP